MRIKWRYAAFPEIRRAPKVAADVAARAERVAAACGDGFVAQSGQGRTRARAAVITSTGRGIRKNAVDNTILRNLGRGR